MEPDASVNEVQELIGTTYPAANDLVARFEDCGNLKEFTGQYHNRRFQHASYIQLFHESPPDDNAGAPSTDPVAAS